MIARCEKQKRHGLTRFSKNGLKERQREKNEHEAVFSKKKKKKKNGSSCDGDATRSSRVNFLFLGE